MRSERHRQFQNPADGIYSPLYHDLVQCAYSLLSQALDERRGSGTHLANNHPSTYAVGSIALLVDGFEAWINQSIWYVRFRSKTSVSSTLELANKEIKSKFYEVPPYVGGTELPTQPDFKLLIAVRNEIVHFLPRVANETSTNKGHVPPWLDELYERRLFFVPSGEMHPEVQLTMSQLLTSYRLAYWAWETVYMAARAFCTAVEHVPESRAIRPDIFSMYTSVCPPSDLPKYDMNYGLSLS